MVAPGTFSIDLAFVVAIDLSTKKPVRIPFYFVGDLPVTEQDLEARECRIDADRGAVFWVKVVDPEGRPCPSIDIFLALPGRTTVFNPARDGNCIVCPPQDCWLGINDRKGSRVALATGTEREDRTITLTAGLAS